MMIDAPTVTKIHDMLMHLQLASRDSIQQYDDHMPYRTGVAIGKYLRHDGQADEVYCHTAVFNAWHRRIWAKRLKEIPYRPLLYYIEHARVWRVGFTSLPEQK